MELANPKAASDFADKLLAGNYMMYYLPEFDEKKMVALRISYGRAPGIPEDGFPALF